MPVMAVVRPMNIELYDHQKLAIKMLKSGSILCGGVGSGKSRTALAYYFRNEVEKQLEVRRKPKDLYIITTARKRDTLEWENECLPFLLSTNINSSIYHIKVVIDSWNNIVKYVNVENAFFIFDEQRVVGSGTWVKSFLKITKHNLWILLTATPGDTWMDYVPVFIANGFYKNRTEFIRRHVVYNRFTRYPKIDHYIECAHLLRLRSQLTVDMVYEKKTIAHNEIIIVESDKEAERKILVERWNIFEDEPIKDISKVGYLLRRVSNSDLDRINTIKRLIIEHPKIIIFYNFNYELDILKKIGLELDQPTAEWNGHKHEPIPKTNTWIYLVQYAAGSEGWNCVETNCIVFYSRNYSYRTMVQAAGRIDRLNTPFSDLYYFHIRSNSAIDLAISKALNKKRDFNETQFIKTYFKEGL